MKTPHILITAFLLFSSYFSQAQTTKHEYEYDASGNRTVRHTVYLMVAPPPNGTLAANASQSEQNQLGNVSLAQSEELAINIFPNPTAGQVQLQWQSSAAENQLFEEVRLYDAQGKAIQSYKNVASGFVLEMSQLAAGTYILWIKTKNGIERVNVVKR